MPLYIIQCTWKISETALSDHGIAVCSDPDTPITFIDGASGKPYNGEIWNYQLHHFRPWGKFDTE